MNDGPVAVQSSDGYWWRMIRLFGPVWCIESGPSRSKELVMEDIDTRELAPDMKGGISVRVSLARESGEFEVQTFGPFTDQQCTVPGLAGVSPLGAVLAIVHSPAR
jgi:hypothetical protein